MKAKFDSLLGNGLEVKFQMLVNMEAIRLELSSGPAHRREIMSEFVSFYCEIKNMATRKPLVMSAPDPGELTVPAHPGQLCHISKVERLRREQVAPLTQVLVLETQVTYCAMLGKLPPCHPPPPRQECLPLQSRR